VGLSSLDMELIRRKVGAALVRLEPLFVPEMLLTFLARHPTNPECFIIVSSDTRQGLIAAMVPGLAGEAGDGTAADAVGATREG